MNLEMDGIICELLSDSTGIILGDDNKYYLYSKVDFLDNCNLELGTKVIFKPTVKQLEQEIIYRAILIEKK